MSTTREVMNKVLRGLRQFGLVMASGTTSTTDDYLLMILQMVNEAKEEIEEAGWAWQALRSTVTVTVASSQIEYDLTIAADADVDTNDRSRLLYEDIRSGSESFFCSTDARPQVFETSTSTEYRLREITQEQMERLHFTDNDETGKPSQFAMYRDADSVKVKLYPTPDASYTLKFRMYIPQAELADDSLEATSLTIPHRPVWTLALFKANQERGEELGTPGAALEKAYMDAHGAAVAAEMTPADQTVGLER